MITLRSPKPDDIGPLTIAVNMPGVRKGTLRFPFTTESFLENRLLKASLGTHSVVGCWEKRAVGLGTLLLKAGRQRHSAELILFVHDEHWGKGLGKALLNALLDLADNWYGLVRVSLDVASTNTRAIRLYESLGFEREGVKRADTICNGVLEDSVLMGRLTPFPTVTDRGDKM